MSPRISIRLLAAQSDERLVALIAQGHERAFETLVHRYRRPLLRYCRRMGLSESRAEDVLQHAFLQAWLALVRKAEVRDLKPWLYRIVHNAAVNVIRRSRDDHSELSEDVHPVAGAAVESELERRITMRDALSDVAALPQMQRQAIYMTAFEGQSHEEVASALGISHGAVRGLLYRARTTLRSAAAALTPPWLVNWAARGTGGGAPTTARIAELSAGGGALGVTGVLLKGGVVAMMAGVVVGSGAVLPAHSTHARPKRHAGAATRLAADRSGAARASTAATRAGSSGRSTHTAAANLHAGAGTPRHGAGSSDGAHRRSRGGQLLAAVPGALAPQSGGHGSDLLSPRRHDGQGGSSADAEVADNSGSQQGQSSGDKGSGQGGSDGQAEVKDQESLQAQSGGGSEGTTESDHGETQPQPAVQQEPANSGEGGGKDGSGPEPASAQAPAVTSG